MEEREKEVGREGGKREGNKGRKMMEQEIKKIIVKKREKGRKGRGNKCKKKKGKRT